VPHLELALDPPAALHHSNPSQPYTFDNERCYGKYIFFHPSASSAPRPPDSEPEGLLDYSDYFRGKSRIWEFRMQFQFKRSPDPDADWFFGTELEEYVPLSASARRVLGFAVTTVRAAIGGLYHTPGDDPDQVEGELERPCFMLPLWAFDQFIETPAGERPPNLFDSGFPQLGFKRYKRAGKYAEEIESLKKRFKVGPTYTFAFWGSSRFGDVIRWRLLGMPFVGPIDLDKFVGKPPIYCALYSLMPGKDGEKRHLQSRKQYHFRGAIWSSEHRPDQHILERLVPDCLTMFQDAIEDAIVPRIKAQTVNLSGWLGDLFGCCSAKRPKVLHAANVTS